MSIYDDKNTSLDIEYALLSALIHDSTLIPSVYSICKPTDFYDIKNQILYNRLHIMYTRTGSLMDLTIVASELEKANELLTVGGLERIAEIVDYEASSAYGIYYAYQVKNISIARQRRFLCEKLARLPFEDSSRESLEAELLKLIQLAASPVFNASIEDLTFFGSKLDTVRERPESKSPIQGFLDPDPHLHLLIGKQKTGKTAFALDIARKWAIGVPAWHGMEPLEGSRVLIISREQQVSSLDNTIRRLDAYADRNDEWQNRIHILARDKELPRNAKRLMTLDDTGLQVLEMLLLRAQKTDPIRLVILDSLSRLKPPNLNEDSNDDMSSWLDAIEDLASRVQAWVILIHHTGHNRLGKAKFEARDAGRGASAIGAVAQVSWYLERVSGSDNQLKLSVDGNSVLPRHQNFAISSPDAPSGSIFFFRPIADTQPKIEDPTAFLGPGERISVRQLAWRIQREEPILGKSPSGKSSREASELFAQWIKFGKIVGSKGHGNAQMLELKETD